MVRNNFDSLPHMPEFTDEPCDDGIEIRWRAVAWRLAFFLVGVACGALIWLGAVTVYGWITR